MIKVIDRYFGLAMLRGYALVSGAILAFFGLFQFMDRAQDVGVSNYSVAQALFITALDLPALWVDLSPFVALLGIIYGLAELVRSNELIAMRANGVDPRRLYWMCIAGCLGFLCIVAATEFFARPVAQQAELMHMSATSKTGSLYSRDGLWTETPAGVLHVADLSSSGASEGLVWYAYNAEGRLTRSLSARRAERQADGSWLLYDVQDFEFSQAGAVRRQQHATLHWQPPELGEAGLYQLPLSKLSLTELYTQTRANLVTNGHPGAHGLEFWQRLSLPGAALLFTWLSAILILRVRPRRSIGGILVAGIAIAFILYLGQQVLANLIFRLSGLAWLAVGLPLCLLLGITLWQANSAHRHPA